MALTVFVLAMAVLLLLVALLAYKRRPKGFPPGPAGLPFVGDLTMLALDGHKSFMKMGEKYGDIIGTRMGSCWWVVLNNPEDIRELFSKSELAGRSGYNELMENVVEDSNYGVVFSTGKVWQEHRRFSLRTLRDFGFGKHTAETIIMEEVRELLAKFKKMTNQPFQTPQLFNPAIFNIIWFIVAGERYDYDDPKLTELQNLLDEYIKNENSSSLISLYYLYPELSKLNKKLSLPFLKTAGECFREKVFDFFRGVIREHERTQTGGSPRDFIDTYLEEVKKTTDASSSFYPNERDGDIPLIATLLDLFVAGSETTSTSLMWSFFLLAQHPNVQDKVAEEIKDLVGNREVLLVDRPHLPYVEATILEIMRISAAVPFGVPHSAEQDVEYKGFVIPKGTIVAANIYAAHHNQTIWTDPENFRPDRFLSSDGKILIRSKAWMPFGSGKRQCMGESLARDELFLFFTNLVHNLVISMPPNEPNHSLEGVNNCVLIPEPHNIIVKVRFMH